MLDKMKLRLLSRPSSQAVSKAAITAFVRQLVSDTVEIGNITSALAEAIENCILYAYPEEVGFIHINAVLTDKYVTISVRDHGVGIKDVEQARLPLFTTLSDSHSGMGFTIMESFMNEVTVKSSYGKGTTVTLKKKLKVIK